MTEPSSQQPRVTFRTPEEEEEEEEEEEVRPPRRCLGKLTIRYDRRELQRRLDIEQWMETQLQLLFDCHQEDVEIPELEINIDDLLDLSESEQRSRLNTLLQQCGKPTEVRTTTRGRRLDLDLLDFINGLLDQINGLCRPPAQDRK